MDAETRAGKKLPLTDLKDWNRWNCMTEGVTLSVFLLPDNAESDKMEQDIIHDVSPHLPGTDVRLIVFLCDTKSDVTRRFGVKERPKSLVVKDGRVVAEYDGIIRPDECWRRLYRLDRGTEPVDYRIQ